MKKWSEVGKVWILYIIGNSILRLVSEVSPVIGTLNQIFLIIAYIMFLIAWFKENEK